MRRELGGRLHAILTGNCLLFCQMLYGVNAYDGKESLTCKNLLTVRFAFTSH